MKTAITFALATLALASAANAATALSYNTADTAGSGTADISGGNFHLATTGGGDKSSFYFFKSDATPLGTLGDLNLLTFDYKVNSNTTPVPASAPALRFFLSNGTSLVWENAYQTPQTTDTVWHDDVNVLGGQFWQRANAHNFDQIPNLNTKAGFQAGFIPTDGAFVGLPDNAALLVTAVQVSFGSGVSGGFDGYVNDINIGFGGSAPATFNATVPEPTTLTVLGAVSALGLRRRRA